MRRGSCIEGNEQRDNEAASSDSVNLLPIIATVVLKSVFPDLFHSDWSRGRRLVSSSTHLVSILEPVCFRQMESKVSAYDNVTCGTREAWEATQNKPITKDQNFFISFKFPPRCRPIVSDFGRCILVWQSGLLAHRATLSELESSGLFVLIFFLRRNGGRILTILISEQ